MGRVDVLEQKVIDLYQEKDPSRAGWADWLFENHVFVVADNAVELARRFGADPDLSRASALLHDIADAVMSRFDPGHSSETIEIALRLLKASGYKDDEIRVIVEDVLPLHSCREAQTPQTIEGKVLATADGLAHLKTDFYLYALWAKGREKSYEEAIDWLRNKLHKDYHNKILFDEIKSEVKLDYERWRIIFER